MKRLTIFSLVAITLGVFALGAWADTIELVDGKKMVRVKIQKEGLLKVEYKKPGLPLQYIDSDRVRLIKYDSTGNDYKAAVEAFENGGFAEAAELFTVVADNSDSRPVFKAHCLYRSAECYQKAGAWKDGVGRFTEFANEYNDHRLYPNALENRAICFMNNGEMDKAKSAFALFQSKVKEKGLPDYWIHESAFWMAFVEERGNPSKALKDYQTLYEATQADFPTVANKARLRIGRVYMDSKKYDEALNLFNEIIANRDPSNEAEREVVSWAYLSRGNCIMNMPKKGDGKEEFKRALYDMLRSVLHYSDVGSTQAESMFWAGKCFQHIGGKDSAKKWQTLFRRIQREWPGTSWAQEATKELGG
jgi:tetratricopeptide (TPR) repeat protein